MNTKEEIVNCLKNFFEKETLHDGVEMAFLYGSWARGVPKEDSDVDIAVVFTREPGSDDELFRYLNDLTLSLSKELGREVNCIAIESNFNKPMLYYNAVVLGLPVFIKDHNKYVRLRNEAVFQMEDFSLFGMDWQVRVTKKNLEGLKYE